MAAEAWFVIDEACSAVLSSVCRKRGLISEEGRLVCDKGSFVRVKLTFVCLKVTPVLAVQAWLATDEPRLSGCATSPRGRLSYGRIGNKEV
jgi:hypothetical protein